MSEEGRLNTVKNAVMELIENYSPDFTIIDSDQLGTFDFALPLVTVKISYSRVMRKSFGNMITNNNHGNYWSYNFRINIFSSDESETQSYADGLTTYLNQHQDVENGLLIFDDFTSRLSNPNSPKIARVIVEFTVFCSRPD